MKSFIDKEEMGKLQRVGNIMDENLKEFASMDREQRKNTLERRIDKIDDAIEEELKDMHGMKNVDELKIISDFILRYLTLSAPARLASKDLLLNLIEFGAVEANKELASTIEDILKRILNQGGNKND